MALDPTPAADAELAARMRLAIARVHRFLRQDTAEGLTLTQLSTLVRIEEHQPVRPGRLAELEGISPSTLTRLIGSLEDDRLIHRMTDPADGRVSQLQLTTSGHQLLERVRSRRNAALQERLATLPEAELGRLAEALPALERLGD